MSFLIPHLSVSQVTAFDHTQFGGCQQRWWFDRTRKERDESNAKDDGHAGHELLAHYLATGDAPAGWVRMGKAVTGVIEKGELSKFVGGVPGRFLIEERFDGQPRTDFSGNLIPLDRKNTLWLGGVPFDGYIDLAYRHSEMPVILDHKFSSDISNAKKPSELIRTVQMPVYVLSQIPFWPDATHWVLAHHNVSRKGIESSLKAAVVRIEQVLERKEEIEKVVTEMLAVAASDETEFPFSRKSCDAWNGCPHQSVCPHFNRKAPVFSSEENELFEGITPPIVAAPVVAPVVAPVARRMKFIDVPDPVDADPVEPPMPTIASVFAPVLPPDAPASKPELASEKPATPVEPKKRRAKPVKVEQELPLPDPHTTPPEPEELIVYAPAPEPVLPKPVIRAITNSGVNAAAVADVLESIARLLRA